MIYHPNFIIKAILSLHLFGAISSNCLGQIIHRALNPEIHVCRVNFPDGDNIPDTTVLLDIQNDGIDDLGLTLNFHGWGVYYHTRDLYVELSPYNSTGISVEDSLGFVSVLDHADYPVDTTLMFRQKSVLYRRQTDTMVPEMDNISGNWLGQADKYFFIKGSDQTGFFDAWIKTNIDSSDCVTITDYYYTYTGYLDVESVETPVIKVYPIPSSGNVQLDLSNTNSAGVLRIFNTLGTLVSEKQFNSYEKIHNLQLPSNKGLYLLQIELNNGDTRTFRLVTE